VEPAFTCNGRLLRRASLTLRASFSPSPALWSHLFFPRSKNRDTTQNNLQTRQSKTAKLD
jgi:hypothetical protein